MWKKKEFKYSDVSFKSAPEQLLEFLNLEKIENFKIVDYSFDYVTLIYFE